MNNQHVTGFANKINPCSEGSTLDQFAKREAESLEIPYEFVRAAVYTQPKGSQHLFYGQGQVSILAVLAEKHGLGILEFGQPKFRMLDLVPLLECQEKIRQKLFGTKAEKEAAGELLGEANIRINDYHRLGISSIEPDPCAIEACKTYGQSYIFFNKKKPAIHSCILPYTVHRGSNFVGTGEGSVEYVIDYSLTKLDSGVGAAYHIIPTMITRAKKLAYEKAFGLSPTFFLKACKMDAFSEFRAENVIENDEKSEDRHKRKLASIDDAIDWQSLPTVIETT